MVESFAEHIFEICPVLVASHVAQVNFFSPVSFKVARFITFPLFHVCFCVSDFPHIEQVCIWFVVFSLVHEE